MVGIGERRHERDHRYLELGLGVPELLVAVVRTVDPVRL